MSTGPWKNFEELEESLTLEELLSLYESVTDKEDRMVRNMAAIFGVDVSDDSGTPQEEDKSTFQDVLQRARQKRREKGIDDDTKKSSQFNNHTVI